MPYLKPTLVRRISPKETEIAWSDGHAGIYPSWYLREKCPCASCVEEFTVRRMVSSGSIPSTLERIEVSAVGNYALNFVWSDRHSTGIYTFEYLRELCPCEQCRPAGLVEPPAVVPKPGSFEA